MENLKKRGPKEWELTEERIQKISDLSLKGCTEATIARAVDLHPSTFSAFKKKFPLIDEIIKKANARGEEEAVGYLWNIIRNPEHKMNFSAILFYLKTKHKWSEGVSTEISFPSGISFVKREDKHDEN